MKADHLLRREPPRRRRVAAAPDAPGAAAAAGAALAAAATTRRRCGGRRHAPLELRPRAGPRPVGVVDRRAGDSPAPASALPCSPCARAAAAAASRPAGTGSHPAAPRGGTPVASAGREINWQALHPARLRRAPTDSARASASPAAPDFIARRGRAAPGRCRRVRARATSTIRPPRSRRRSSASVGRLRRYLLTRAAVCDYAAVADERSASWSIASPKVRDGDARRRAPSWPALQPTICGRREAVDRGSALRIDGALRVLAAQCRRLRVRQSHPADGAAALGLAPRASRRQASSQFSVTRESL